MASRAFMEVAGPSTDHDIVQRHVVTEANIHGPHPDSTTSSIEEAHNQAAELQLRADSLQHHLNEAYDYIIDLKSELEITNSRLESALRQRPYFDSRRQQIVRRSFVEDALEQKEEIQQLKKEINEKTNKHDSVMSLWQDALEELEEAKSSKTFLTVDDDAMTSMWKQLQFIIKNLSTSYLYGLATSGIGSLTPEDLERYRQLVPIPNEGPAENEYSCLCQILIWEFITAKILAVPTVVWGHDVYDLTERLFSLIKDANRVSASEFHAFRAETGGIMKTSTHVDPTICNNLKTKLKAKLQPFTSPENTQEVTRQLDNIIDKAVDLAIIFAQSRSFYQFRTISRSSKRLFDDKIMDNVGDGDGTHVIVSISPALFKYGNSRGENYGERMILAKATVLCGAMT